MKCKHEFQQLNNEENEYVCKLCNTRHSTKLRGFKDHQKGMKSILENNYNGGKKK